MKELSKKSSVVDGSVAMPVRAYSIFQKKAVSDVSMGWLLSTSHVL